MPEALRSFTTRGWALLSAGVATIVAALVTDHPSLARLGVLVAVLPLIAALWVGRSRDALMLARAVSPQVAVAGQPVTVDLTLRNRGASTSSVLRMQDGLPVALGSSPRFTLDGIDRDGVAHARYHVTSDVRGQFDIGPLTLRLGDPFGLVEVGRVVRATNRLTVTPRVVPLPSVPLSGAWAGAGDNRPRAFATGSAEDVTVRDYRQGDDLRRVHWRSSARVGDLMVRREEQPRQTRATVFLDNRAAAHRGRGAASSLEAAVTVTASVAAHLARLGYTVRLVTAAGDSRETQWHSHTAATSAAPILEALAVLELSHDAWPDTRWLAEPGSGGTTIGIFGSLADADRGFVGRLRHQSSASMALVLDVKAWGAGDGTPDRSEAVLTGSGWRTARLGPGDRLDLRWQEVAGTRGSATHAGGMR